MRIINIENDKWEYKKHEAFKEWMDKDECDVIFYCDVDTLITNHSVPIENFLDETNSYYITKDFNEINNGVLILKCDEIGNRINDRILSGKSFLQNEQNAINHYTSLNGVKILPHPSINSYSYDLYPECKEYIGREDLGDWGESHFLVHFPGLSLINRIDMMNEFKEKIIE